MNQHAEFIFDKVRYFFPNINSILLFSDRVEPVGYKYLVARPIGANDNEAKP